jgi:beta-propeller repeat-containing protein
MDRPARPAVLLALAIAFLAIPVVAGTPQDRGLSTAIHEPGLWFVEQPATEAGSAGFALQSRDRSLFLRPGAATWVFREGERGWAVRHELVGGAPDVVPVGRDPGEGRVNRFTGPSSRWQTGLRTFGAVAYPEVWPGVDMVYRGAASHVKYDLVVRPNADPSRIRLAYRGAEIRLRADGSLSVHTPFGGFVDHAPRAWQVIHGERRPVPVAFTVDGDTYGFSPGAYDRSRTLWIDPAVIVYCGFLGGTGIEYGHAVAVDHQGHAYVAGYTMSSEKSFPVKTGPFLVSHATSTDAFIAKIKPNGKGLVYCGFLSGSSSDKALGVAVDSKGYAYVTGTTSSTDFPVAGAFGQKSNGSSDAFVTRIARDGKSLIFSGYLGGARADIGQSIAVDGSGNMIVAGFTQSDAASFPVKGGPTSTFGGQDDAFVAKIDAAGTGVVYAGYLGGPGLERATGVAVDGKGHAYVCGFTNSNETTFPVKVGPDLTFGSKYFHDAFVAKVDGAGQLIYCGYIGGTSSDTGNGIAVDSAGCAYVAGTTTSRETSGFPVAVGPDLTYNGGFGDAFVAKVAANGKSLAWCGYVGGDSHDYGFGIGLDANNHVYLLGQARSTEATLPVVNGPDPTYNGGLYDAFLARIAADGKRLDYCGFLGGAGWDVPRGIAVDRKGNAFVIGDTDSDETTFPVKNGPALTFAGGTSDAWVARIGGAMTFGGGGALQSGMVPLVFWSSDDPGLLYHAATSLGAGPFEIDGRAVPLTPDRLLRATLAEKLPHVCSGYSGTLDALGEGHGAMWIPEHPNMVGLKLHTAFITLDPAAPSGIKSISSSYVHTVTP